MVKGRDKRRKLVVEEERRFQREVEIRSKERGQFVFLGLVFNRFDYFWVL